MYYIHDHLLCTHRVPGDTTGARQSAFPHGGYIQVRDTGGNQGNS